MKREITFDMPSKFGTYRVVCRIGYDSMIPYAWWGYLQKQEMRKPWPWSKPRLKWFEIDRCWWSSEINSIEDLKKKAEKWYDEIIEMTPRLLKKGIELK